uniref:Ribosome-binding ATPase YchF n=1 Tax=candidate division CPR3 bacterium TaxID=2268181 RepID=A0A7C4R4T0_UNCC3
MLQIGIIGLPNVGKSTIFNALNESASAESSNYPFCTIEPNVGIVEVPDDRLAKLAEIEKSRKIVPAAIKFVDIAGLVKGASKGEGLGNKFLSHIKEVDAVVMVVRCFADSNVIHVAGKVDPADDIAVINLELILADLEQVERAIERTSKNSKSGSKEEIKKLEILIKIKEKLEQEIPIRDLDVETQSLVFEILKDIQLITDKPIFYIGNISEDQIGKSPEELGLPSGSVLICAKTEAELKQLPEEERKEYLESIGIDTKKEFGALGQVITRGYDILGLISFLTAGEIESRAWTIRRGTKAPQAAGVIHGDFEKKFIAMDVVPYEKFVESNGWVVAREKGFVRTEGKTYEVRDGDVVIFKHG